MLQPDIMILCSFSFPCLLQVLYLTTSVYRVYCRFCGLKGHEMFCEVERSYIEDGFNLYGLRACVTNFSDCLDLILDRIGPDDSDDSRLTQSACTLYGLIHARYIITAHGLDAMYNKVSRPLPVFIVFSLTSCSYKTHSLNSHSTGSLSLSS